MNQSLIYMPHIQESGRKEHKQGSQWLQREEQMEEVKLRKWKLKESKRDESEEDVQKAAGEKGYVMERWFKTEA